MEWQTKVRHSKINQQLKKVDGTTDFNRFETGQATAEFEPILLLKYFSIIEISSLNVSDFYFLHSSSSVLKYLTNINKTIR